MKTKLSFIIMFILSSISVSYACSWTNHGYQFQSEQMQLNLRSGADFDTTGTGITFTKGIVSSTGSSFAVRGLEEPGTYNYTIQGSMLWDGTQFRSQLGYTNAPTGTIETLGSQHRYFGFNATIGFYYNDGAILSQLIPPSELSAGWYVVTLMLRDVGGEGEGIVSLRKERSTLSKSFIINDLPTANNMSLYVTSTDKIKNVRYLSHPSTEEVLLLPLLSDQRNEHIPLTMMVDGIKTIAHIPASYDLRKKNRVVIFFHGAGGGADDVWTDGNKNNMIKEFLNNGYVVIASDNTLKPSWGNSKSTIDSGNLLKHYQKYLNIENQPYIYASSMGGIVALNSIAQGTIKPKAFMGLDIVANLDSMYDQTQFQSSIQTAFSFTLPSQFETATNGYDVVNDLTGIPFKNIPIKLWASYNDTLVDRIHNSDALKQLVENVGGTVLIISKTGDHGDSTHYEPKAVVDFFNSY